MFEASFGSGKIIQVVKEQFGISDDWEAGFRLLLNVIPSYGAYEAVFGMDDDYWKWFFQQESGKKVTVADKNLNLPKFLAMNYQMRADLQSVFDLETDEGQKNLWAWFLRYGFRESSLGLFSDFQSTVMDELKASGSDGLPLYEHLLRDNDSSLTSPRIKELWDDFSKGHGEYRLQNRNLKSEMTSSRPLQSGGVNMIGFFSSSKGIAEDARMLCLAFQKLGIPVHPIEASPLSTLDMSTPLYKTNIFCLPASDTFYVMQKFGREFLSKTQNILRVAWELPYWQKSLECLLQDFSQLWTYSQFIVDSVPSAFKDKTKIVPMPVLVQPFQRRDRTYFELPEDEFLFISSFDFESYVERKNPLAVIDSFLRAFPNRSEKVSLLIKSQRGKAFEEARRRLQNHTGGDSRIRFFDVDLNREDLFALYDSADALVSLHRSEGLGRNMAEAMLLGKPVIATAFSGNVDFTKSDNSYLVDFTKVPLKSGDYIFWQGQYWAEPSVEDAAAQMRACYDETIRGTNKQKIANGRDLVADIYSVEALVNVLKKVIPSLPEPM
jgi:glycosyltransferase involved in cell wall biosynthesis